MSGAAIEKQLGVSGGVAQALLTMLNSISGRVLAQQPVDSHGNPTGQVVYLQLPTGLPIDPREYENAWSPSGGDTLATIRNNHPSSTPAPAATSTEPGSTGSAPTTQANPELEASLETAENTSSLVNELFQVSNTGQLKVYPTSRKLSFEYESIIKGMQPQPAPPVSPQVQQAVKAAMEKLYTYENGNITGQTPAYQAYLANQMAYAQAKSAYATEHAEAMANPVLGNAWPETSAVAQTAVTQAYDNWMAQGAPEIEEALATVTSVGVDVQAEMVSQARQLLEAWQLGLSGVASSVPLSKIRPVTWYDSTDTSIGFSHLKVSSNEWLTEGSHATDSFAANWYQGQSSSTGGSAGGMVLGITFGASGSHEQASNSEGAGTASSALTTFNDETTGVSIAFEWALCTIERPWLMSDLFHLSKWYLVGNEKDSISDGTIAGQVGNERQLMPMIPTAFVVVRNVEITAENWGQAGVAFEHAATQQQGSAESSANSVSGSVGFLCIGGSAAHSDAQDSGQGSVGAQGASGFSYHGTAASGTLSIHGTQLIGWIGEIVPASPPESDPSLEKEKKTEEHTSEPAAASPQGPTAPVAVPGAPTPGAGAGSGVPAGAAPVSPPAGA